MTRAATSPVPPVYFGDCCEDLSSANSHLSSMLPQPLFRSGKELFPRKNWYLASRSVTTVLLQPLGRGCWTKIIFTKNYTGGVTWSCMEVAP